MKNLLTVGLLMLGLGFAMGWLAKPVPSPKEATPAVVASTRKPGEPTAIATRASETPAPAKKSAGTATAKMPSNMPTEAQMAEAKKMQADMSKAMVKRMHDKLTRQIDRLTENLHLSDDQKRGLTTSLDEKMKKLEGLDFTDPKSMSQLPELTGLLTEKSLEDQLVPTLTADQKTALVEFKDRERHEKADAAALKNLSKLQGSVDLEPGQREEVYKRLSEGAEASALAEEEKPDLTKLFTEGMGIEMDPYDLGLQQAMMEAAGDPSKFSEPSGDQKSQMSKLFRQVIDKRIEAKVELLRPVLNDKQLDQYRAELRSKGLGVYGPMLMNQDGGDGGN